MRISRLDSHPGRFVVVADGPADGDSTYPECWGSHARFPDGRAIASGNELASVLAHVRGGAWVYDRSTGKRVGRQRLAACVAN